MKITVEQKHIDAGRKFSPSRCPIALAFRDAHGRMGDDTFTANVSTQVASVWDLSGGSGSAHNSVYALPLEAQEFARRFDIGFEVKPFEFELGENYAG